MTPTPPAQNSHTLAMSIATRVTLIVFSFSLSLTVPVYRMVAGMNADISAARLEQAGDSFLRPLVDTLVKVQNHQVAAWRCEQRRADCAAELAALTGEVDSALTDLADADAGYGAGLKFTAAELAMRNRSQQTLANVQAQWSAIVKSSGSALQEQYQRMNSDLRTMITDVGDTSNLILDPDRDSYYLMDATLVALPQALDRLALVTLATEPGRVQTAIAASQLTDDRKHITESIEKSLHENFYGASPTLGLALTPALKAYQQASLAFEELTLRASRGERVDSDEYLKASAEARQAALFCWHTAVDELDKLLDTRAGSYRVSRNTSLALSGFGLFLAGGLAFALVRSIGESVKCIAAVSPRDARDPLETQIICEELHAYCNSMRDAIVALARQVNGSSSGKDALESAGVQG